MHQLETNTTVDSIYLDFSKAFDKCDHRIILDKALGITGENSTDGLRIFFEIENKSL